MALFSVLSFALACGGGMTPEQRAARDAERAAAKQAELAKKGPARSVKDDLGKICQGDNVNLAYGLAGHTETVGPKAAPTVLYDRWVDGGLADANTGKVRELGPTDLDWYYALDVYCSSKAVCEGTACTLEAPDDVHRIEHRVIDGEPRIVGVFMGTSMGSDAAGIAAARKTWQAAVDAKYPPEAAKP